MTVESDPRFLRSRELMIAAARQLLVAEGPTAVTHARVAEAAGVGRATVYRHWTRIDQLLADAMASVPLPFFSVPTVPTRDWLRAGLLALARELELRDVRAVATTLANTALWDTDMDARRASFASILVERLGSALAAAESRGEVVLRGDPRSAAAQTIGPIYYRSTIEHGTIEDALIDGSIDGLGEWS